MKAKNEANPERAKEARELVDRIWPSYSSLNPRERSFVRQLKQKIHNFGVETFVSVKQIQWLRDIEAKVSARGGGAE